MFFAPFVWIPGILDYANLAKSAYIQIGALFLSCFFFLGAWFRPPARLLRSPVDAPLLLFLTWAGLSALWAQNPYESLITWIHWIACGLVYIVVANTLTDWEKTYRLLFGLFLAALGISLLGIAQHLANLSWIPQAAPPASTFANRNMAVQFILMTWPLGLGLFLTTTRKAVAIFAILSCAVILAYLAFTLTRAGWLAASAQIAVLALLLFAHRRQRAERPPLPSGKLFMAAGGLALWFILVNLTPSGVQWKIGALVDRAATVIEPLQGPRHPGPLKNPIVDSQGPVATHPATEAPNAVQADVRQEEPDLSILNRRRFKMWINTWEMIKDHPWRGVGLANQKILYPAYSRKAVVDHFFTPYSQPKFTHNDYLQLAAELGLVGACLALMFGVAVARLSFRVLRQETLRSRHGLWVGLALGLLGLSVDAVFSFPLQLSIPPFVLMVYLGALSAGHARQAGKPAATNTSRREESSARIYAFAPPLAAASTLILLLGAGAMHYQRVMGSKHYLRTNEAAVKHAWQDVINEGMRAYEYNPFEKTVLLYVGFALSSSGRYGEAVSALREALRLYPNRVNGLSNLAVAYARAGEPGQAIATYRRVLAIKPDCVPCLSNMALIQLQAGNMEAALTATRKALKQKPEDADLYFTLGYLAYKTNRFEEAALAYGKAIAYRPGLAAAHKNLGAVLYQHLDRRTEGIKHIKKALQLDPEMATATKLKRLIEDYRSPSASVAD